jgi:hypothetical protein
MDPGYRERSRTTLLSNLLYPLLFPFLSPVFCCHTALYQSIIFPCTVSTNPVMIFRDNGVSSLCFYILAWLPYWLSAHHDHGTAIYIASDQLPIILTHETIFVLFFFFMFRSRAHILSCRHGMAFLCPPIIRLLYREWEVESPAMSVHGGTQGNGICSINNDRHSWYIALGNSKVYN